MLKIQFFSLILGKYNLDFLVSATLYFINLYILGHIGYVGSSITFPTRINYGIVFENEDKTKNGIYVYPDSKF